MADSRVLTDYTVTNLHDHIKMMNANEEIIQVLQTNQPRTDSRTGCEHRDYLLIFKRNDT